MAEQQITIQTVMDIGITPSGTVVVFIGEDHDMRLTAELADLIDARLDAATQPNGLLDPAEVARAEELAATLLGLHDRIEKRLELDRARRAVLTD